MPHGVFFYHNQKNGIRFGIPPYKELEPQNYEAATPTAAASNPIQG
jgi:hypothetical protein